MKLESLPNEVLLNVFEYVGGTDILRAFDGLNSRFETLLVVHFQTYHLNLQSISKRDFDLIYQQYLPLICDRIHSLCFSDDRVTPNLPHLLFSNGLTLHHFTRLHSLSIVSIHSQDMINKMLQECSTSSHLTYLKISECSFPVYRDFSWLTNSVWRLPKLIHFSLHMRQDYPVYRLEHNVNSSTLKHVIFNNCSMPASELTNILTNTPQLLYLHTGISYKYDWNDNGRMHRTGMNISPSITTLKITSDSLNVTINILKSMPSLHHLTMDLTNISENYSWCGYDWEKFIVASLPKLKTLQFRMMFSFRWCRNEDKVDELLNTFRTPFWLVERHWFVRCEYNTYSMDMGLGLGLNGSLYTLPYSFEVYNQFDGQTLFKSTCPHDEDHWSYTNVRKIDNVYKDFNWSLCPIRLPNIECLTIGLPTNGNIWHVFPKLHCLSILNRQQFDDTAIDPLQVIISRAPHLYTLIINKSPASLVALSKITSSSIRRIEWRNFFMGPDEIFDHENCITFATSPLARQCESLSIAVEEATDIFYLINTMPSLRSLTCQCREDNGYQVLSGIQPMFKLLEVDRFIERLKTDLTSTDSIRRVPTDCTRVELWLR